ncbi:TIGR02147 family protein [Halobacteriovorax sp.]|uniref:TIGR02147 family protein n=1 Tax=Halobacteriovorax sp. TaxID=2020862 RepID=UPI003AF224C1
MDIRGIDLFSYIDYRLYLEDVFSERKKLDRKYTFGKWAKELGISSVSGLTMILKGQRHPGPKLIKKLIENLKLNEKEADFFTSLVQAKKNAKGDEEVFQVIAQKRVTDISKKERQVEFKWEMALIREMLKWKNFNTTKDLSSLPIIFQSNEGYQEIIEQMKSSTIIKEEKKIISLNPDYEPQYKLEMSQFVPLHQEICDLSDDSYYMPKEQRILEHVLINVKKEDLTKARKKLYEFIQEFTDEFDREDGSSDDHQIFNLTTLFFPFTK